jgi:hypothetical protein
MLPLSGGFSAWNPVTRLAAVGCVLPARIGWLNVGNGRNLPLAFTRPGGSPNSRTGPSPTTLRMNGSSPPLRGLRSLTTCPLDGPADSGARKAVPNCENAQMRRYCRRRVALSGPIKTLDQSVTVTRLFGRGSEPIRQTPCFHELLPRLVLLDVAHIYVL